MYAYGPSLLNFPPVCRPLLKSSLNLVQRCFCFMLWFSGPEECGMWLLNQGWNPQPLQWKAKSFFSFLEGKVLTTGPQGSPKSLGILLRASTPEHWGQRGAPGQLGLLPLLPDKDGTPAWVWSGVHQGPSRASHQLGQSQEPSHPQLRSLLQLTAPASLPFVKWEEYPKWRRVYRHFSRLSKEMRISLISVESSFYCSSSNLRIKLKLHFTL